MNPSQSNNIQSDNHSVSSHYFQQNQTHSLSQRHLTQTQIRTGLHTQTQQPSYMPSNIQSQNISEEGSVNPGPFIANFTVEEIKDRFRNFLISYEGPMDFGLNDENEMFEEPQIVKIYVEKMNLMKDTGNFFLMVDADHLYQSDKDFYRKMVAFPGEVIPIMDIVAIETFIELRKQNMQENNETEQDIQSDAQNILVGIFNMRQQKRVRDIQPTDINRLVSVKGIVIRCSNIFPEMRRATFECTQCKYIAQSILQQGKVEEPVNCPNCKGKFTFQIKHNLCNFTDKQYIKIQETPESIPEGETPQSNTLVAYDTNVDNVRPGDRIECIGVLRAQGVRQNSNRRTLKSVYNTFIDVISFSKQDRNRFLTNIDGEEEQEKVVFSDNQKRAFHDIADDEKVYQKLVKSLAPSIWENEDVKKGVLCQLFGGTPKDFKKTGKGRFRAEINCLLVGDPSVAKSQMLQYVHKIAPRGVYTSGKGSSAVGLTAYVTRDPETKDIILESGALVLSDLGICCIDEFDKMDDSTRTILLEAMEQQTISIAKSGIVAQLNARTAVLAGANPIESKYNPTKSVVENINLSPPLLSRFDLIYIMLDSAQQTKDEILCQHLLNLYSLPENMSKIKKIGGMEEEQENDMENEQEEEIQIINKELFAQYISYARNQIKPVLTDDAVKALQEEYCELRKQGQSRNVIVCTTRQLESAIRLSEAQAKMRLRTEVTREDVDEAFRLIKVATQSAATDPTTGLIDMDVIQTGRSAHSMQKLRNLQNKIEELIQNDIQNYRTGVTFQQFKEALEKEYATQPVAEQPKQDEIEMVLRDLIKDNVITQFGHERQVRTWTIQYALH